MLTKIEREAEAAARRAEEEDAARRDPSMRWTLYRSAWDGNDVLLGDRFPSRDAALEAARKDQAQGHGEGVYATYATGGKPRNMVLGTMDKHYL